MDSRNAFQIGRAGALATSFLLACALVSDHHIDVCWPLRHSAVECDAATDCGFVLRSFAPTTSCFLTLHHRATRASSNGTDNSGLHSYCASGFLAALHVVGWPFLFFLQDNRR